MIYKDYNSHYDLEHMPCNRYEDCLNCGQEHGAHSGWKCDNVPSVTDCFGNLSTNFSDYLPTDKYFTQSMKDSIVSNAGNFASLFGYWKDPLGLPSIFMDELHTEQAHQTVKPTIDQWQAWAHNQPGDCACGIKKDSCDYHKSP